MAAIEYSIDEGPFTATPGAIATLDLTEGRHSVTFRSRDGAGNRSNPKSVDVGVDLSPPSGWFDAVDPLRPRRVSANVTDPLSGVAAGDIEYRSAAGGEWQSLAP